MILGRNYFGFLWDLVIFLVYMGFLKVFGSGFGYRSVLFVLGDLIDLFVRMFWFIFVVRAFYLVGTVIRF